MVIKSPADFFALSGQVFSDDDGDDANFRVVFQQAFQPSPVGRTIPIRPQFFACKFCLNAQSHRIHLTKTQRLLLRGWYELVAMSSLADAYFDILRGAVESA